jgi:small subunit ribosomal protein S21
MKSNFRTDFKRKPRDFVEDPPGVAVALRDGESADSLIRRFKKKFEFSGILKDLKRKEFHLTKSQKRRLKSSKAQKRLLKEALEQE